MRRLVIFALLVAATSSVASSNQLRQKSANQNIRKFDLKSVAYREAAKTLRQDWAEAVKFIKENGDDDWVQAKYIVDFEAKPTYGDITGDGSDEAAVNVQYNLKASNSTFTAVFVYTLKNGSPSLLARIKGGDRAHGSIESVKIINGQLIVGRYRPTADDCNACYGFIETTRYKWLGSRLVKAGVQVKKYAAPG